MKHGMARFATAALLAMVGPWAAFGVEFTLEVGEKPLPADISAEVKAQLAPKSYTLSEDGAAFMDIWLVSEIALSAKPADAKEALAKMPQIQLLGVVNVLVPERHDFRDDPIDKGLYVMRLALQPQDGNHMGTAPFDTFAMLIPNARDGELKGVPDHDKMVDIAKEKTVTEHPPILSLQPMKAAEGEFPRIDEGGEEWHFLTIKLPGKSGADAVEVPVQLVFDGIGDL